MSIKIKNKGKWSKTFKFLDNILEQKYITILQKYAELGRRALAEATPVDTGTTRDSWGYEIVSKKKDKYKEYSIVWTNSNIVDSNGDNVNVAILIQYGHATKNGGFVEGVDYINPALQPIFDRLANAAWGEVTKA